VEGVGLFFLIGLCKGRAILHGVFFSELFDFTFVLKEIEELLCMSRL
jgi:hypothetical protein